VMKIKIAEGELDLNSAVNCGRKWKQFWRKNMCRI
jgi:hypothetical protein